MKQVYYFFQTSAFYILRYIISAEKERRERVCEGRREREERECV